MNKHFADFKDSNGVVRSISISLYKKWKDTIYRDLRPVELKEVKPIVVDPIKKEVEEVKEEVESEQVLEIEALRSEYFQKTGKEVSNKFKNDADWIKSKIDGL